MEVRLLAVQEELIVLIMGGFQIFFFFFFFPITFIYTDNSSGHKEEGLISLYNKHIIYA